MLNRLYPGEKHQILILQEAEWTPGPVWTRRNEETSPPPPTPGLKSGPSSPQLDALTLELPSSLLFLIIIIIYLFIYLLKYIYFCLLFIKGVSAEMMVHTFRYDGEGKMHQFYISHPIRKRSVASYKSKLVIVGCRRNNSNKDRQPDQHLDAHYEGLGNKAPRMQCK